MRYTVTVLVHTLSETWFSGSFPLTLFLFCVLVWHFFLPRYFTQRKSRWHCSHVVCLYFTCLFGCISVGLYLTAVYEIGIWTTLNTHTHTLWSPVLLFSPLIPPLNSVLHQLVITSNSAAQDQSLFHISVTLTPVPPAFGNQVVNMPTAVFYVSNKGRASQNPGDPYLIMLQEAL